MKYIRFIGWLAAAASFMIIAGTAMHLVFAHTLPGIGVTGNEATAGGYTMEVVVSVFAFGLVCWRILFALEVVNGVKELWNVLKSRAAVLSLTLAGIIGMTSSNRFFWWQKHFFTSDAFDYTAAGIYTGAANSAITSFLLCVLVYAMNADPETASKKSGISSGLSIAVALWGVGFIAFILGTLLYPGI